VYTEVVVHCYYHQFKEEVVHHISDTTSADTYIEKDGSSISGRVRVACSVCILLVVVVAVALYHYYCS
jgi:hypothetical protein